MREFIESVLENFIKSSSFYKEIEKEAENYNAECSKKETKIQQLRKDAKQCIVEKQECILSGQGIIEEKISEIKGLKKENADLKDRLQEKEKQRRKAVGSVGGYKTKVARLEEEIENLNERIEFLKHNRRAPSIEELKDYEYRRKKK